MHFLLGRPTGTNGADNPPVPSRPLFLLASHSNYGFLEPILRVFGIGVGAFLLYWAQLVFVPEVVS
jgi:hypothetical protein